MRVWPIANIKNSLVRRVGLVLALPFVLLWFLNWRLLVWPFAVLLDATLAAGIAFRDDVAASLNTRSLRLLRAGIAGVWSGRFLDDGSDNQRPVLDHVEAAP